MPPRIRTPGSRTALARRAALSVLLGVVFTLALCLLFSFRSSAYQRTQWQNVMHRGDVPARAVYDSSLGKSIVTWAPLRAHEVRELEQGGKVESLSLRPGPRVPPAWSAYWDDEVFATAAAETAPYAHQREDIAVGWPWRAFTAMHFRDRGATPSRAAWRTGYGLPMMLVDRGLPFILFEIRAIPFRPIWSGLLADVGVASAGAFVVLSLLARGRAGRPIAPQRVRVRPRIGAQLRPASIIAALAVGLLTTALTGTLLPMTMRQRSVSARSTERPYTSITRDTFWSQRATRIEHEDIKRLTASNAPELDAGLGRLEYSTDPARMKTGPRDQIDGGPPNSFISTRTGWPFPVLWGASWRIGDFNPVRESVNLTDATSVRATAPFLGRGLKSIPTRPLWYGWVLNTIFFALAWMIVVAALGSWRGSRRMRRGLCPCCAYDLRGTPTDTPCPECGDVTRPRHAPPAHT